MKHLNPLHLCIATVICCIIAACANTMLTQRKQLDAAKSVIDMVVAEDPNWYDTYGETDAFVEYEQLNY